MKTYTITRLRTYSRFPGQVYAHLTDNEDDTVCISATLTYIIKQIADCQLVVSNYRHIGENK